MTRTGCLSAIRTILLLATILPVAVHAQEPNGRAGVLRLSLPGVGWTVEIQAVGFVVKTDQQRLDGRARYLYAVNPRTALILSVRFERGAAGRNSRDCRVAYWEGLRARSPFTMDEVSMSEVDRLALVEYLVKEYGGVPVHQKHLNAYFGKDDVCMDLHLSKVRFVPADQALFEVIVRGVQVIESPGR